MSTLAEIEARAQRQLDGMRVNRDAMARDVLMLVRALREIQQRNSDAPPPSKSDIDSEIFRTIFGGNLWGGTNERT